MESLSPTLIFVTHAGCTESALSFSSSLQSSVSRCTFVMESVAVNEIWSVVGRCTISAAGRQTWFSQ